MNLVLLLLVLELVSGQQYKKHKSAVDFEVPHELIFREQCWTTESGEIIVPKFCSNNTNYCSKCYFNKEIRDYRNHYMSYNDNRLIVGALDNIFAFDVTDNLFTKLQQVDAKPSVIDANSYPTCLNKDFSLESCRNFNRVLLPIPDNKILTCGTNAYSRGAANACQIREVKDLASFKRMNGQGFVPIYEHAQNTATAADSRIFAGSMLSSNPNNNIFVVSSAKIGLENGVPAFKNIVTTKPSSDVLNRAKFVASFSSGDYVYFLFQEIDYIFSADSSSSSRNKVVSRIARVCKEDTGTQWTLEYMKAASHIWQTFVKSRIYCVNKITDKTFGEQTFTYNRVGAGVIDENRMLYAAFSEGDASASGSVICRFNLTDIDKNFDNSEYYNFGAGTSSRPLAQKRTPPTCADMGSADSDDLFELRLTVKDVTSPEPPLFLQSGPQFTKLLLDTSIRNLSNPVIFIGTNMGKVLKVSWTTLEDGSFQPVLIESLQVAKGDINSTLAVNFLAFEKTSNPNYLFVGTGTSVSKVVISRCLRFPNLTQNCCYASLDPYCGWCSVMKKCTSRADCSSDWIQSSTAEVSDTCETDDGNGNDPTESAVASETASWKTVAIVMAILCGIFILISAILALNLARKWCYANRKPPQKMGNNNLQHNYNPLSPHGPKSDDFSDRIPVYNTRTGNV